MSLSLLAALLLSQTDTQPQPAPQAGAIYEWTDATGQTHFTDDPSTIPKNARAKTTQGKELMVVSPERVDGGVGTRPAPVRPTPVSAPEPPAPSCAALKREVEALEARLAGLKTAPAEAENAASARCQQLLMTHGKPAFAHCMATRQNVSGNARNAADVKEAEAALAEKREQLRRAQVGGCS